MACPADGVMESEAAYLAALQQAERIEVDDTELVLSGEGTELTFTRTQTGT
ncbi:MAG: META domain-containing protein [Actinomycetota bacterium]